MNTQNTPLVQKLIFVMLVLIFGCLVLMLINSRKQIEVLSEGNGPASSSDSNAVPSIHKAFPSMRSSRPPAPAKADAEHKDPKAPETAPAAEPRPAQVVEQPPIILPAATVIESPEAVEQAPEISGRVILIGRPPMEKVIHFDAMCGNMHSNEVVTTRHYVVSPDGGLANVFVYISKGFGGRKFPKPTTPVLLDQEQCMYQPYIFGAMVNQPIQIKNSDPILHNVHALPKANGNNEFNFAQPLQNQIEERSFPSPEVFIKLKCEVHDWMFAYVGVVDNPYFAVTDTNGVFQLPPGIPPGQYEVTATHLRSGAASKRFVLRKNASVRLDFRLRVDGKNTVAQQR